MSFARTKRLVSAALICSMIFAFTACGKEKETETTPSSSSETIATIATTTTSATTLTMYEGPLETADTTETSWTETALQNGSLTLYASVSAGNFLRVRKGPSTDYEIAGTLTRGQSVVVVASTANNWYKTEDGYYVSGEYLKTAPPA